MTAQWSTAELDTIDRANEVQLSTARTDGSLRSFIPVWVVRIDDGLYVRSYGGRSGSWYRHARRHPHGHLRVPGIDRDVAFTVADDVATDIVDEAYRTKYGRRGGSYVGAMTRNDVAATTLRLSPR